MKTSHERSRNTHHNDGARPLYYQPRTRNARAGWTGSVKLTLFLCVALILAAAWAYRTFTT